MFERYTERARQVVVLAQEEARGLKHNYIGTEHVLLGLIAEGEGVAAHVLGDFGFTLDRTRQYVTAIYPGDVAAKTGQIPFTPRTKKVFELATGQAISLGHNYVGTEHLLMALLREEHGVAYEFIVKEYGSDGPDRIRQEVVHTVSGRRPVDAPPVAHPSARELAAAGSKALRSLAAFSDDVQALGSHLRRFAEAEAKKRRKP